MDIYHLEYIDITNEELAALRIALNSDYTGIGLSEMLHRTVSGQVQIWRIGGLILLTQIDKYPNGQELWIITVAGKFPARIRTLAKDVERLAKSLNCKWVSGTTNGKFSRLY